MTTVKQTMLYRQALIKYSQKYGVTKQQSDIKQTVNMCIVGSKDTMERCNPWRTGRIDRTTIPMSTHRKN